MMSNPKDVDALLRQLDAHRDAYMATFQQMHELLTRQIATSASGPDLPQSPSVAAPVKARSIGREHRPRLSFSQSETRKSSLGLKTIPASTASRGTGEDSDDEDCDYALYVHQPLETQCYTEEMLRKHLMRAAWQSGGKRILKGIVDAPIMPHSLFPTSRGPASDRSDLTLHQVWDIGADGAPVAVGVDIGDKQISNAMMIWNSINRINPATREHRAVGRITILREPSPALYGAIHLTHDSFFDMDQIFDLLVEPGTSKAVFNGAFSKDERRQRSFVFSLEYFTLVGDSCLPTSWQMADLKHDTDEEDSTHIGITRCSSIVALSLSGKHIKKVKNHARRAADSPGHVYDPFAAWQVLNLQAYPDWNSSGDVHDTTKHYVNGVEAFLITLLGEFRDALVRYEKLAEAIARITRPPTDFMFNLDVRDKLQFEDEKYTYSRRYFWAYQTLGTINASIKAMVDAYEDNLVDDVWEGKHKTIWPISDESDPRSQYYKKRMDSLKLKFEREMSRFKTLMKEIREHREEVVGLREELFVGTSIHESRNSVKNTEITIQQGYNIKLLTLVSIFFLPLTFVTSVFGMTNMPAERQYWHFGIVTATVCVPFFILIGSLNTTNGMEFWREKSRKFVAWLTGRPYEDPMKVPGIEYPGRPSSRSSTKPTKSPRRPVDSVTVRLRRVSTSMGAEMKERQSEEEEIRDRMGQGLGIRRPPVAVTKTRRSSLARLWSEEKYPVSETTQEV